MGKQKKKSFDIDTQNESTLKTVFNNHFTLSKIHFNAKIARVGIMNSIVAGLANALPIKQSTIQLKTY